MVARLRVRMVVLLQKNLGLEEMVLLLPQPLPPLLLPETVEMVVMEVVEAAGLVVMVSLDSVQAPQLTNLPAQFLLVVLQLQEVEEMEVLVEKVLPVLASCTTIHPKSLLNER